MKIFIKKFFVCLIIFLSIMTGSFVQAYEDGDVVWTQDIIIIYTIKAMIIMKAEGIEYNYDVDVGDILQEPSHPEKEGYQFDGWYDEDGNKWNFSNPVTDHLTLYARYSKKANEGDVILQIEDRIGYFERDFLEYLKAFGLEGDKLGEEYSDKYSRGRIIRHDFGNIAADSKIGYIVSLGPKDNKSGQYVSPPTGID